MKKESIDMQILEKVTIVVTGSVDDGDSECTIKIFKRGNKTFCSEMCRAEQALLMWLNNSTGVTEPIGAPPSFSGVVRNFLAAHLGSERLWNNFSFQEQTFIAY